MGSSSSEDDIDDLKVVERDPTGRYVRYEEILGEGASKTVYKGFDEVDGIEVAWSKIELSDKIVKSEKNLQNLCTEAQLLKSLKHDNIMRCYHSWVDGEKKIINMITELFTSGNLGQYRKKHNVVDNKAIKNWARQILKGLDYLHCHDPPIIHRDLKCDNIFVNGNSGKVKLGDLGLAIILEQGKPARSLAGTPVFMAPELFEQDYDQLVDIYSFGMCLLQMFTRELPYTECTNSGQIYKKVSSGIKPHALSRVTDPQVKQFIEMCLSPASERPSANKLLNDPFLATSGCGSLTSHSLRESLASSCSWPRDQVVGSIIAAPPVDVEHIVVKKIVSEKKVFKLQGKMKEKDSISLTLWIAESEARANKIEFVFLLQTDTAQLLMEEMARDLSLSTQDATLVTDLMEELIAEVVPNSDKCSLAERKDLSDDAQQKIEIPGEQHTTIIHLSGEDANSLTTDLAHMSQSSTSRLSDKGQQYQVAKEAGNYENVRRGNCKGRKEVVNKPRYSCIRKLLFLCRNKF